MHFDAGLGEGEVARNVFHFRGARDFLGEHFQKAQKGSQVDVVSQNDSFRLVKVAKVGRVNLVVSKAAGDSKVFSGNLGLVQLVGAQNRSLASQNQAAGELVVKLVVPTAASAVAAVFMYGLYVAKIRLLDCLCVRRVFDAVNVVDVAGGVELWHE